MCILWVQLVDIQSDRTTCDIGRHMPPVLSFTLQRRHRELPLLDTVYRPLSIFLFIRTTIQTSHQLVPQQSHHVRGENEPNTIGENPQPKQVPSTVMANARKAGKVFVEP